LPKKFKKTPDFPNISIKPKLSYGVHAIMDYQEHLMLKCQEASGLFSVDELPDFKTEREFKKYVAESKEYIGCYITEDEGQTERLDSHLKALENAREEIRLKREAAKKAREEMISFYSVKKVLSDFMVFGFVSEIYKQKFREIVIGLVTGNVVAKRIFKEDLVKQYLTMSVAPLLRCTFY
jgi:predicted RND superfamily exporter protein